MPWGRRCDLGCESWPDDDEYGTCPICDEPTTRFSNLRPLDADDAQSILAHRDFNDFYAAYCSARGQTVDGPLTGDPEPLEGELDLDAEIALLLAGGYRADA